MRRKRSPIAGFVLVLVLVMIHGARTGFLRAQETSKSDSSSTRRRLYVAEPGIRDYLEYGGHGLLVFDIDHNHRFIKRIPTAGVDSKEKPLNVKGVCANAATKRIFISTTQQLMAIDLVTEKLLWEKRFEHGCDRMSMTPDGRLIFLHHSRVRSGTWCERPTAKS